MTVAASAAAAAGRPSLGVPLQPPPLGWRRSRFSGPGERLPAAGRPLPKRTCLSPVPDSDALARQTAGVPPPWGPEPTVPVLRAGPASRHRGSPLQRATRCPRAGANRPRTVRASSPRVSSSLRASS
ncbi:uncharacterized protein LOC143269435 [Peromyscus maniculatus bairdii]|uniref:uncharacterized protein LOC143269435 n=1 Tax=Peromyscus maniculatus bairdii TaxID=230844 RepID=UPI003FD55E57